MHGGEYAQVMMMWSRQRFFLSRQAMIFIEHL